MIFGYDVQTWDFDWGSRRYEKWVKIVQLLFNIFCRKIQTMSLIWLFCCESHSVSPFLSWFSSSVFCCIIDSVHSSGSTWRRNGSGSLGFTWQSCTKLLQETSHIFIPVSVREILEPYHFNILTKCSVNHAPTGHVFHRFEHLNCVRSPIGKGIHEVKPGMVVKPYHKKRYSNVEVVCHKGNIKYLIPLCCLLLVSVEQTFWPIWYGHDLEMSYIIHVGSLSSLVQSSR